MPDLSLTWTSQPPTEAGYYWWRRRQNYVASISRLSKLPDGKVVLDLGWKLGDEAHTFGGEWAGPIQEPQESMAGT